MNIVKHYKREKRLDLLLREILPNEYRYVGNGKVWINGKCPDFINVNGQKKIIEFFGDYWHRGDNPKDRMAILKPFGYETLVLWERELKDIPILKTKILNFNAQGKAMLP